MVRLLLIISALVAAATCAAAPGAPDTMTGIMNERIKSLQVRPEGNDYAPAVIVLDTGDRIKIDFDHLAEDREYFRYRLTHCDAHWRPSGLVDSEFLDGFNEGTLDDYRFSSATTVHYVHYTLTIPNADVAPKVSGNYLLTVYPENDPDSVLLQCRFMVTEQTARIGGEVTSRTDVDYNAAHQQLSIVVDSERAGVDDPFNDIMVMVQQNGRYDNETAVRQPLRVVGSKSYYEHQSPLIFDAGNEYRRMETVSVNFTPMHVSSVTFADPYYHFMLDTDQSRAGSQYLYDSTQHGRFTIREYNSTDSDVDADYVVVHFSLDYPEMPGTMIFLDGDFTSRRFDPESIMAYNSERGRYERAMLLKQGAYNYQYLAVPPGKKRGCTSLIEGDKYQTVNEYTVKVYHRRRGERYDRLIGVTTIRSGL